MKCIFPLLISLLLLLTGCGGNAADGSYQQITQEEAKEMMDSQEVIILDVREQDEYDSGHIPGAMLLPAGTIDEATAADVIPEKDSTVLVYCRSGNRSKTASKRRSSSIPATWTRNTRRSICLVSSQMCWRESWVPSENAWGICSSNRQWTRM